MGGYDKGGLAIHLSLGILLAAAAVRGARHDRRGIPTIGPSDHSCRRPVLTQAETGSTSVGCGMVRSAVPELAPELVLRA